MKDDIMSSTTREKFKNRRRKRVRKMKNFWREVMWAVEGIFGSFEFGSLLLSPPITTFAPFRKCIPRKSSSHLNPLIPTPVTMATLNFKWTLLVPITSSITTSPLLMPPTTMSKLMLEVLMLLQKMSWSNVKKSSQGGYISSAMIHISWTFTDSEVVIRRKAIQFVFVISCAVIRSEYGTSSGVNVTTASENLLKGQYKIGCSNVSKVSILKRRFMTLMGRLNCSEMEKSSKHIQHMRRIKSVFRNYST